MPTVLKPAEFFVVGGPVQPERPCYVERAADRQIGEALQTKRLCCVLGPRAIGKSSLLHRAVRSLRSTGTLAALVDLRRLAEHHNETPDGWLRSFAARVAAELKLGVDVDSWWEGRGAVGGNRLVEFFWEVVLTNTTAPVVVLVDEVDAALELPFFAEFVDAVNGCYARRGREPDFARLNFVLAGCTSQRVLAAQSPASAFAEALLVEPADFAPDEAYRLAVAFGGEQELAQALMDRICVWTGGHPYLTQRVARGVARKEGRLEDVERVVREQLLAPGAADRDPHFRHVRAWLSEPTRPARRAAKLLRKLAAGATVTQPADPAVAERLWLSGTVRLDEQRRLRIGSRIVKELVAARWLKTARSGRPWLAVAAVLLVAIAAGGYWYTQYLPVADSEALRSPSGDLVAVEESYRRLRALPGFAERADALWIDALARRSREAATLAAATAADTRLRELPGQDAAADGLLGEFWLRRARAAAHAEQRDAALLLAQRAAALPAADPAAAAYLAELVGDDYLRLERSLRLADAPSYWHMAFTEASLVSIDREQQALRTPFGAAAGSGGLGAAPWRPTALEHAALVRELAVEGDGTAGELELSVALRHVAAPELLVTLTAPGGAQAAISMPRSDGAAVETFLFQAAQGSPLAQLADERLRGVWRLTVVDRQAGNTGVLAGWGLRFADEVVRDDPPEPLAIPDPTRVETVGVRAVADRAVAWPLSAGAIGTVAVWNLVTGRLEHDFTLPAAPRQVAIDPTSTRILGATDRVLMLWNIADGALVARVATETEFVLPPVFSTDGGYVAIAERVDGASPLYSVLRSADASLVASIEGVLDVQSWELGPGARYLALLGPASVVRVLETRRGTERKRLAHDEPVERMLHSPDGAALSTIDRAGAIASWSLAAGAAGPRVLGHTAAAAGASVSADGRRLAFTREDGAISVLDLASGGEVYRLRHARASPVAATQLSADGAELVTASGAMLRLWSLPPQPLAPSGGSSDAAPTALALDRASELVAVGLRSGQLEIALAAELARPRSALAFFGHRGQITAAALNGSRGIAVTGGSDGVVRLWDTASSAPTGVVMQPADAAIALVALSADGRLVASAAARAVRVATVADGRVTTEVRAEATVTALAFAPDGQSLAVGDAGGAVAITSLAAEPERVAVQLGAAATSLAFAPDGQQLAAGDAAGAVTLIGSAGEVRGVARHWSQPLRWLDFSPDGSVLFAATDLWLHALEAATPALAPLHSKLVALPFAHTVLLPASSSAVRSAGFTANGLFAMAVLDLAAPPTAPVADSSTLVGRDWPAALALRLNDNGEPVPFDP
jgi:WD40 repeat protein/subtilisin-like proprotein convertase family protein